MTRLLSFALTFALGFGGFSRAEERPASLDELKQMAVRASQSRASSRQKLERFLTAKDAQRSLERAGIDSKEVMAAIATLDQEDVDRLAARADKAQRDFTAGAMTNQELTYVVIALATAVVILVIVAA